MFNVLRADLFRITKSKSTWVILIGAVLFFTMPLAMLYLSTLGTNLVNNGVSANEEVIIAMMVTDMFEQLTLMDIYSEVIKSNIFSGFIILFAVLFAGGHSKTGYIKSISGLVDRKYKFVVSELVIIAIYTLLILVVSLIAMILGGLLFFKGISFGDFTTAFPILLLQFILLWGVGFMACCLTGIVRNMVISLIVFMIYTGGFAPRFYSMIDQIVNHLLTLQTPFSIANYSLVGNLSQLQSPAIADNTLKIIMMTFVIISISFIVTTIIKEKQDIK